MRAFIVNFRRGPKTQKNDELIVEVPEVKDRRAASRLIGRKVVVEAGNLKILGSVVSTHGSSGRLRVRLRRGIPGQLLTAKVEIV